MTAAADGWKVFAFISILDAAAAAVLVLRTPLAIRNMGLFLHTIREAFASYFSRHSLGPTRAEFLCALLEAVGTAAASHLCIHTVITPTGVHKMLLCIHKHTHSGEETLGIQ